ncbi:MAG: NACHT domain-containing protein [Aphanothece sp. CMT-3BRIN-NPC111]|jgi:predicted NACHT family NTPase|nr:NACHT domain-containing protein [Aphanothece sp. CMT-3BRIN-NPC111]
MLPTEFLTNTAREYELSPEQSEAFVKRFNSNNSEQAIADELHISQSALRSRMTEIYTKFSIGGKGPGKYAKLVNFLNDKYRQVNVSGVCTSISLENDIDALVQQVRKQRHDKIQHQCGTMRMLDVAQAIALADIYTDVNVLEQITCKQWREISDLLQGFDPESDNFDRLGLGKVRQERVPGLNAVSRYSKLMVLGKPGSGKTTFLQWVAIRCSLGEFHSNRVPIFIRLKNFAEDSIRDDSELRLFNYISEEFASCGITDKLVVKTILTHGKTLILLDGLDEVAEADEYEVVAHIRRFFEKYFKNQFIITCRIAASNYKFQEFTDVEVADFNSEQVEVFAKKWFLAVARNDRE